MNKTISTAVGSLLALGTLAISTAAPAHAMGDAKGMEKCFGVVKAGKNDCGTSKHACAGQAAKDGAGDEWIHVPTGTCEKLVGGSLKPKAK
jgi:uncharacterized membrane protein